MYTDDYGRDWNGPYRFDPASITSHAPREQGVYQVLYSEAGEAPQVAYIGIATGDTIYGRLRKHCGGNGNWALSRLGDPMRFSFVYYLCDESTARQIESHVLVWQKPAFNVKREYKHYIPSIAVH